MSKTLTPEEKEQVCRELRRSAAELIQAARAAEWSRKPSVDAWSPAEICEHVWRVDRGVLVLIRRTPESDSPSALDTAEMLAGIRERTGRIQAPERVRPQGTLASVEEFASEFHTTVESICEYVITTEDALHARVVPHAILGPMTGYQWFLFLAAHCERHTKQLLESVSAGGPAASPDSGRA